MASWLTDELKKTLNYNDMTYAESGVKKEWLASILELLEDEKISGRNAEMLLREVVEDSVAPEDVLEEKDLLKAESSELSGFVEEALEDNPDAVEDYCEGKEEALNFLVGQVMQKSKGKADPKEAREKLVEELD